MISSHFAMYNTFRVIVKRSVIFSNYQPEFEKSFFETVKFIFCKRILSQIKIYPNLITSRIELHTIHRHAISK